jgi:hypothetical protein
VSPLASTTWSLLGDPEPLGASLARANAANDNGVDWALDDDGDVEFPFRLTTPGVEAVKQGIRIRIQTFLGEWFLDLDFGIPWFEKILGQKFNEAEIRNAFRALILETPGVLELISLTATYTSATRTVAIDWVVRTADGVVADTVER